jgi:hypothetical protein
MAALYAQGACAKVGRIQSIAHRFAWEKDLTSQGALTIGRAYYLRVAATDVRRAVPVGAFAWGERFRLPRARALVADPAQVRLGQALAARVTEVTRLTVAAAVAAGLIDLTSPRFAKQIRDVHTLTSRAIARFLITGQGTTETERNFICQVAIFAARHGLSLATLSRSYAVWRDANLRVMNEEINRLAIGQAVAGVALGIIRSSAETGLRRMARAYEYQVCLASRERSMEAASRRALPAHKAHPADPVPLGR